MPQLSRHVPALLRSVPDFRRLWLGQTVSVFGDEVGRVALPLVAVLVLGAEAAEMGSLTAAGLLPHLLFSLAVGVWLDRVRRRLRVMVWADVGRALLMATVPVAYVLGVLTFAQLYVVTFLVGALTIRLRADYLAIATFGVAVAVQLCALNLQPITGGPFGISFIPRPFGRGLEFDIQGTIHD